MWFDPINVLIPDHCFSIYFSIVDFSKNKKNISLSYFIKRASLTQCIHANSIFFTLKN